MKLTKPVRPLFVKFYQIDCSSLEQADSRRWPVKLLPEKLSSSLKLSEPVLIAADNFVRVTYARHTYTVCQYAISYASNERITFG